MPFAIRALQVDGGRSSRLSSSRPASSVGCACSCCPRSLARVEWIARARSAHSHGGVLSGHRLRAGDHWFDGANRGCYDAYAGWSSLVARWAHNPKVGGSNPPPATKIFTVLAGFTDFHLGQIRVTNSRYCTEVVIVGHSTQISFSGFQPSCAALRFTKATKRRCRSRLASICGAPYTWEVVAMFSCRSRVLTSSSVNPASFPQALTVCRKLCQPIFGRPALTAIGCT